MFPFKSLACGALILGIIFIDEMNNELVLQMLYIITYFLLAIILKFKR